MNITIFTSNNLRHNYLINKFAKICDNLFVFQETRSIFPGIYNSHYRKSKLVEKYFRKVDDAQSKVFGKKNNSLELNKIKLVSLNYNDLNFLNLKDYKIFFNSHYYIVFGSSYIKGDLLNYLVKKKAINIHMGVAPYYKGTDCNFWALLDDNKKLVGATIHYLSKQLDGGSIISHAYASKNQNPFLFSMSATKNAINKLYNLILKKKIFKTKFYKQNNKMLIRYSTKKQFTEKKVEKFFRMYNIK